MKILVRGYLYEIASIQVIGLGTFVHVQYVDPKAGLMMIGLRAEEFQAALVWENAI